MFLKEVQGLLSLHVALEQQNISKSSSDISLAYEQINFTIPFQDY